MDARRGRRDRGNARQLVQTVERRRERLKRQPVSACLSPRIRFAVQIDRIQTPFVFDRRDHAATIVRAITSVEFSGSGSKLSREDSEFARRPNVRVDSRESGAIRLADLCHGGQPRLPTGGLWSYFPLFLLFRNGKPARRQSDGARPARVAGSRGRPWEDSGAPARRRERAMGIDIADERGPMRRPRRREARVPRTERTRQTGCSRERDGGASGRPDTAARTRSKPPVSSRLIVSCASSDHLSPSLPSLARHAGLRRAPRGRHGYGDFVTLGGQRGGCGNLLGSGERARADARRAANRAAPRVGSCRARPSAGSGAGGRAELG